MSSIDERAVRMKFDNAQFQSGVSSTLSSLDKLKRGLNFKGGTESLSNLDRAAKGISFESLAQSVQSISGRFSALSVVAITALSNITNAAINAGTQLAKSIMITPIMDGFREYETKMGSIQTIMANTAKHGTTLETVNRELEALNTYADDTIYSFGDMTKNIGLFTNAGLKVEDSTQMIKGFANAAAASGTDANRMSGAAYQLSQGLSAGRLTLMDWNSLVNAGMGNNNMQQGLIDIATATGDLQEKTGKNTLTTNEFRDSLQKGWVTTDVMSTYLRIMAGDIDEAEMKTLGLTEAQVNSFVQQAQTAEEAATKVRTWTQLVGATQEAVGSGWGQTFELLFGGFNEATELFSSMAEALTGKQGFLTLMTEGRNKVLKEFVDLGGRTDIIKGLTNTFDGVVQVVRTIGEAFRQIFPPTTGAQLKALSAAFLSFTERLKMGSETADNLKRTFAGVFAIFSIGWQIIKAVAGAFVDIVGALLPAGDGFLGITASVGDFFVALDKAMKSGQGFTKVIETIGKIGAFVAGVISGVAKTVGDFFSGLGSGNLDGFGDSIRKNFQPITTIFEGVSGAIKNFGRAFGSAFPGLITFGMKVGDAFKNMSIAIMDGLKNVSFENFMNGVMALLASGALLSIRNLFSGLREAIDGLIGGDGSKGMFSGIGEAIGSLTGYLETMQQNVQAKTILLIAAAVGILAVSMLMLSTIEPKKLAVALGALTASFGALLGAMFLITQMGILKSGSLVATAAGLVLVAIAVAILASAVKTMSDLDWNGLAKGLSATVVLIFALSAAVRIIGTNGKNLRKSAVGLIAFAVAIRILASAVQAMADMNWGELARGLAGVLIVMAGVLAFAKLLDKTKFRPATAAGILILALALKVFASAVEDFSGMDWGELAKGFAALAGIFAAIIVLSKLTGGGTQLLVVGAGMIGISAAIVILAGALERFAKLTWPEIAKAMVVLAGSLLILAGGMYLMTGAIVGAAALVIVTAALTGLVPVLKALGGMSLGEIGKALLVLAGAFTILGVAGALLAPVAVPLLIVAGAIALLGIGAMAAGAGMVMFASGLAALAVSGVAGVAAIAASVTILLGLIPAIFVGLAKGVVAFAQALADSAVALAAAFVTIGKAIIGALAELIPGVVGLIVQLVIYLGNAIRELFPFLVQLGFDLILALLRGIRDNIGEIVTIAGEIIVNFINGISAALPAITQAAVDLIVAFLDSLAAAISGNSGRVNEAAVGVVDAILAGLLSGFIGNQASANEGSNRFIDGVRSALINRMLFGIPSIISGAKNMASGVKTGVSSQEGSTRTAGDSLGRTVWTSVINGIVPGLGTVLSTATRLGGNAATGVGSQSGNASTAGRRVGTSAGSGLSSGLNAGQGSVRSAGSSLGSAAGQGVSSGGSGASAIARSIGGNIARGLANGITGGLSGVISAAASIAGAALSAAKARLDVRSPSREFAKIGRYSAEGFSGGLIRGTGLIVSAAENAGDSAISAMQTTLANLPDLSTLDLDIQPTIRPILDLSDVTAGARQLSGVLAGQSINVGGVYQNAARLGMTPEFAPSGAYSPGGATVQLNQYNYSPKALSPVEIYRQTNNQLSQAKRAIENI